jgi:integral membrane protein
MVQQVGMAHGVLFVAYIIAVILVKNKLRWNTKQTVLAMMLSFVPLGTFYVTAKMMNNK